MSQDPQDPTDHDEDSSSAPLVELTLPTLADLTQAAADAAKGLGESEEEILAWSRKMKLLAMQVPWIDEQVILAVGNVGRQLAALFLRSQGTPEANLKSMMSNPAEAYAILAEVGEIGAYHGSTILGWMLIGWRIHQAYIRRQELQEL